MAGVAGAWTEWGWDRDDGGRGSLLISSSQCMGAGRVNAAVEKSSQRWGEMEWAGPGLEANRARAEKMMARVETLRGGMNSFMTAEEIDAAIEEGRP